MALFMTPEQVRVAEQQRDIAQAGANPYAAAGTKLGQALSGGIGALFGVDPRSQMEQEAAAVQSTMQGVDLTDRASLVNAIRELNADGHTAQAIQLMGLLPKPTNTVARTFYDKIQDPNNPGNYLIQQKQQYTDGSIKAVGSALTSKDALAGFNLGLNDPRWSKQIVFGDNQKDTVYGQLKEMDEFKGFGIFTEDTDPEQFTQLNGVVQGLAQNLKDQHRDRIQSLMLDAVMDGQPAHLVEARFADSGAPNDDYYIQAAYQLLQESGALADMIDEATFGGDDIKLDPGVNYTDPVAMRNMAIERAADLQARQAVQTESGRLVRGDPSAGQFNIANMEYERAKEVFSQFSLKGNTDEQIRAALPPMSDEQFESHSIRWNYMRENPVWAERLLASADSSRNLLNERARLMEEAEEAGNPQKYYELLEIARYLSKFKSAGGLSDAKGPAGAGRAGDL